MAKMPKQSADRNPITKASVPSGPDPCLITDTIPNTPAAPVIGILKKNENLAAASRDNPEKSPAVIVIPERLVPGAKAMGWAQPIIKACFQVTFSKSFKEVFCL